MDLKQFVAETISQIVEGVLEADRRVGKVGAAVNPPNTVTNKRGDGPYGFYAGAEVKMFRPAVQEISFDVVVNATQGTETKGGIGIQVGSIGLGRSGRSESENSSESRVKFSIPLLLPNSKNEIQTDTN
jgi:hypothetical protein